MEFFNYMVRYVICMLPFFLLLWIYPDTVYRGKQYLDHDKKVPYWDHATPEVRHRNFKKWANLYFIFYFGLYIVAYLQCETTLAGLIVSLFFSPIIVTDYLLGVVGLDNLAYRTC